MLFTFLAISKLRLIITSIKMDRTANPSECFVASVKLPYWVLKCTIWSSAGNLSIQMVKFKSKQKNTNSIGGCKIVNTFCHWFGVHCLDCRHFPSGNAIEQTGKCLVDHRPLCKVYHRYHSLATSGRLDFKNKNAIRDL